MGGLLTSNFEWPLKDRNGAQLTKVNNRLPLTIRFPAVLLRRETRKRTNVWKRNFPKRSVPFDGKR